MMTLALRMGRTVGELMETMTAAELMLWQAFDQESPISDRRGDVLAAQVAAAAFQAQGRDVSLADLVMEWGGREREAEASTGLNFLETMKALAALPDPE